ncbi:MAG: cytochrome c3 family protein [Proteobacteria bacterium]|nr:cytochrome c3 family protein [Pseudomonadota bacterium]
MTRKRSCFSITLPLLLVLILLPDISTALSEEPQDIIIIDKQKESRGEAEIPPVRFSHSIHKANGVTCDECHPDLFKAEIGANDITMKQNIDGEFCGKCHMGTGTFRLSSWNMSDCMRCHRTE